MSAAICACGAMVDLTGDVPMAGLLAHQRTPWHIRRMRRIERGEFGVPEQTSGSHPASVPTTEERPMNDLQNALTAAGYEPVEAHTGGGIWLMTVKTPDGRTVYIADEVDALSIEAEDGTGWNVAPAGEAGIRWVLDTIPMVAAIPASVGERYETVSFIATRY